MSFLSRLCCVIPAHCRRLDSRKFAEKNFFKKTSKMLVVGRAQNKFLFVALIEISVNTSVCFPILQIYQYEDVCRVQQQKM